MILAVLGVILIIFPEKIVGFIGLLLGIFLVITGLLRCYTLMKTWEQRGVSRGFALALAVLILVLGIFLLMNRSIAVAFISVVIGVFAVVSAADRYSVMRARRELDMPVASTVISGLIHLLFGIGMITMPLFGASLIIIVTGLYLIVAGVMVLLSSCIFFDL